MEIPAIYCESFHESNNRPHLLLGCEGLPLGAAFVLSVVIGFSIPKWWGIGGAVFLFLFLRQVLRELAKEDPHFFAVHFESQRYIQQFWTAKTRLVKRWRS